MTLRWRSNNGPVADRAFSIARVVNGEIELMPDPKTGNFVGVYLKEDAPPDFITTDFLELEIMAEGAIESVQARLIPYPYPTPDAQGNSPRMYDMVIGGTTYTFDSFTQANITIVTGPYTIDFGYWGFVEVRYDTANQNSMPTNGSTTTILTITSMRVSNPSGTQISGTKGPIAVKITGVTPSGDTTKPTVLSVLPGGIDVALNGQVTISCSEDIIAGTGNYYIYNATTGNLVETIAAASASYLGSQITFTPVVAQSNSTSYSVRWDAGTFKDNANNGVLANTGNTYSWITIASSGGGGNPGNATADVVVSSYTALIAQLDSWKNNWNGTVPAGKTAADDRVVGINASTTGRWVFQNYTFPHRVYIRHVGIFTSDMKCSVFHTHSGNGLNTANLMSGCTNLFLYLMDLRSINSSASQNQMWDLDNNTQCGVVRCAVRGWEKTPVFPVQPTTSYGFVITNSTDFLYQNNVGFWLADSHFKTFGTHTRLLVDGNIGDYIGGDDFTIGAGSVLVDPKFRCNFFARNRAMVPGNHNDCIQFNKENNTILVGAKATRWFQEYDIALRGVWIGPTSNQSGESGWGGNWFNGANTSSTGPHYVHDCLYVNGHDRAFTSFQGGGNTVEFCSAIQHDNSQPPNKAYPAITGTATSTRNFVCGHNSGYVTQQGTGGLKLLLGGTVDGLGANYSLLLPYCTNIPTNFTDLWDIRPPVGAVTHPNYSPSGNRVGCFGLWQKLFNGDSDIVLSKIGWPVAPIFISNYDRGKNFPTNYTGSFNADGNNA